MKRPSGTLKIFSASYLGRRNFLFLLSNKVYHWSTSYKASFTPIVVWSCDFSRATCLVDIVHRSQKTNLHVGLPHVESRSSSRTILARLSHVLVQGFRKIIAVQADLQDCHKTKVRTVRMILAAAASLPNG